MSVIVPINNLNPTLIRKLDKDLHVKPILVKKGVQQPLNLKPVEAFDTFTFNNKNCASIPLSYYYHHLSTIERIDNETSERDITFKGELLPRQKEVREEIIEILNRTGSVVLSLRTGFGKTIMAIYLASKIKKQTIILCHRKIIIEQWVESIKKYCPNSSVRVLGEKVGKKYTGPSENEVDFLVCNVVNIPKKDRTFFSSFGLVIVDEVHTVCTESFSRSLLYIFPEYLIGLSATPFRSDGMDRLIELFCGPEIVFRKLYRAFNAYKINTGFKPNPQMNVIGNLDWNGILEEQANCKERNELIVNLCRYFTSRNILVLVKRKEHAAVLKNLLLKCGEDVDMFTGDSKECNYECRVLIATYSISGVGFDHAKLDTLIAAADVLENFTQYIGRVFRRDDVVPVYIDLVDEMSTIKKHSQERLKICKELGAEVKTFDKMFPSFNKMISYLNL